MEMCGRDRVFDHPTQKVSYSRTVKFDEQEKKKESVQHPLILNPINETRSDQERENEEESGSTEELPELHTTETL
jgi:hypothetical protein